MLPPSLLITLVGIYTSFLIATAKGADPPPSDVNTPFVGKWTYRSWINDPSPVEVKPDTAKAEKLIKLLFAEAELVLEPSPPGELHGRLDMGPFGILTLSGSAAYGTPFSFRIQGVGKGKGSPSEGWVYDYIG